MSDLSETKTPSTSPYRNLSCTETPPISNVQTKSLAPEPTFIPYGVKLNAVNYSLWSQVVETFVVGHGKLGYLIGET